MIEMSSIGCELELLDGDKASEGEQYGSIELHILNITNALNYEVLKNTGMFCDLCDFHPYFLLYRFVGERIGHSLYERFSSSPTLDQ